MIFDSGTGDDATNRLLTAFGSEGVFDPTGIVREFLEDGSGSIRRPKRAEDKRK